MPIRTCTTSARADGGVWKTTNGGLHLAQRLAADAVGAIGATAVDPRDPRDRVGRHRRAEPPQRRFVRRRRVGHARRRRALAQRRIARNVGDRANRRRSNEFSGESGWPRSAILIETARSAASTARSTAEEPGIARSISDRRAARRISQSIRAIPTSSSPASGNFGACRGPSPAAARLTASSSRPTAARRGADCAATDSRAVTWAGSALRSRGGVSTR